MHDIQQELDASAARGETEPIDARMLLLDIISLNVFPFIGFHIIEPVFGDLSGDREHFSGMRRAENVEIILRRLKKHDHETNRPSVRMPAGRTFGRRTGDTRRVPPAGLHACRRDLPQAGIEPIYGRHLKTIRL